MVYMVNMANMVNMVTCAADKMSAPPAPPAAISMVAEARGTHRARATMWGYIFRRERDGSKIGTKLTVLKDWSSLIV